MPELDFAFLADFARSKSKSLDALSIGIDTIIVNALPTSHQMYLAVRIAFARHDCDGTYQVEAIVQDTDGRRLTEFRIEGSATWPDVEPPGNRVTAQAVIPLLVPLEQPGPHSVDIALDGRPLKTITFVVVDREAA
jgi:hypothetical protein